MKGIVLAAGAGTRLYPITRSVNKQLLPIYDKPMIYYPISTLMEIGIQDILLITSEREQDNFKHLLGDGSQFGIKMNYAIQYVPKGISDAFIIAEEFIGDDESVLILGDNIFYGESLRKNLVNAKENLRNGYSTVFGYKVDDPERFGVIEFNDKQEVVSLEEKPTEPKSNYAATGLYFYTPGATNNAKTLKPSARGEIEITDLNKIYLNEGNLKCELMGTDINWIDTGTYDSMLEASIKIKAYEEGTSKKVAQLEEIALRKGYLSNDNLKEIADNMIKSGYQKQLTKLL
ncbi:Glucose-1-phosphate thymidylyltransferase 1 [Candidatus Izimaplasma bacterium HR1]|jgi:glucose-1-phosphate thymidylyltransferase|uniref:glucose-1-phosphate thymidylyltransferase RfbA n=1 Tax=Candidatus Izimoplasma sp. HR1 TaxID=1541959 RepID=UPI0004F7A522|nr:Glucose-1-phosphate thymidylyltransferase 1 [Candidatus Izimaplasma bacterium HR1]